MSKWRGEEFIEEFIWLTENGMSMIMASQLLGVSLKLLNGIFIVMAAMIWRAGCVGNGVA